MSLLYFGGLAVLVVAGFLLGRNRAAAANRTVSFHSRPNYHGAYVVVSVLLPALLVFAVGVPIAHHIVETRALAVFDPSVLDDELRRGAALRDIVAVASGRHTGDATPALARAAETWSSLRAFTDGLILAAGAVVGLLGVAYGLRVISAGFRARNRVERVVKVVLFACACVAVLTTVGIVFSVLFESIRFFQKVSPLDFLFGLEWSPQTAIRADQVGSSGAFGIAPLVVGTLLITMIAMLVAGPIGLFAAIYLAEYASPRFRAVAKPLLEILAGIPTVVLGFFAALSLAPWLRELGQTLGLNVASESALAAGLVMGMMIIPFVSSLSDDVINAVPQSLRDGSYGMGATKSETIKRVVLPAAFSGIVSAMMLAISRAVGETMIVVMAAGLAANLTFNPLEAVTTFTVQIKTILVGDQEFDSAKTLAAFALGLVLFFFTLTLNVIAMQIVKRYREQYD
ncbi:phosphate ABC transporter permease subunit PstC [Rhodoplanes elegans]|uniref:Phosphate transport system permease protein n=1 Tax=Rhodoplanes elegans TaxID=29408 RepID=A0A327K2T9_9BRAD|nr:phosphate ABC transporter permease subunit PstC [Rhodoplanes elegans]MBK5956947.1 phosphate ABC transporter permease subunit PstC [Rhodoplanes elegans]RAI32591.1 phosphate ABC transporter permease subunit PstC [Rhodoplanes elegans]